MFEVIHYGRDGRTVQRFATLEAAQAAASILRGRWIDGWDYHQHAPDCQAWLPVDGTDRMAVWIEHRTVHTRRPI